MTNYFSQRVNIVLVILKLILYNRHFTTDREKQKFISISIMLECRLFSKTESIEEYFNKLTLNQRLRDMIPTISEEIIKIKRGEIVNSVLYREAIQVPKSQVLEALSNRRTIRVFNFSPAA